MIITIIDILIFSAIFVVSLTFLFSIRKNESPFNHKTVKKLKVIAILLIIFEVQYTIAQHINPIAFFEGYLEDGTEVYSTAIVHWSGFVVVAGLVVYCVALILQHGISLQTQVDETL